MTTLDTITFSLLAACHPRTTTLPQATLYRQARLRSTSTRCTRWRRAATRGCRSARGSGSRRTGTASRRRAPGRVAHLARQRCPGHSRRTPPSLPTPPPTSTQTTRATPRDAPPYRVPVRPCHQPQWTSRTHQVQAAARQTPPAVKRAAGRCGRTLFDNWLYPSCLL